MNNNSQTVGPPPRVAIVGATGYAGQELVRLLARHPHATLATATASQASSAPRRLPALARIWEGDVQPLDHPLETSLPFGGFVHQLGGEGADVAAGHEVPAGTADDDDADRRIGGQRRGLRNQRVDHREIEGVERGRTVQRQRGDRPVAACEYGVVHRRGRRLAASRPSVAGIGSV